MYLVLIQVLGSAEWEGGAKGSKSEAFIYWYTPEEWANMIWDWVKYKKVCSHYVTHIV